MVFCLGSELANDPWMLKAFRAVFEHVLRRPIETARRNQELGRQCQAGLANQRQPYSRERGRRRYRAGKSLEEEEPKMRR